MDPIIGGALISAGAGLVGGLLEGSAQESANETNIQLQREQQAWQENMWNKQNEYNTPAAQIQRMREAGLNPALMYSRGEVGNAGSVGSVAPAHVQPVTGFAQGIGAAGSTIGNAMIQLEQVKQMRAQTQLLQAKATKEANSTMTAYEYWQQYRAKLRQTEENANYMSSRTAGQDIYNIYEPKLLQNQVRHGELSNTELNVRTTLEMAHYALNVANYQLRKRMTDAQVTYTYAAIKLAQQKYDVIEKMTPEQFENLVQSTAKLAADTKITEHQDKQLDVKLVLSILDRAIKAFDVFTPDIVPIP